MLGRFLITASVAAMLSAAPAFAQQEGQPIIKPPAGKGGEQQPGKQGGQEMQRSQQMPQQQNEAQGNQKLIKPEGQDQGQPAGKKQEPAEGQTATGEESGQTVRKKKAQQQPDEATGGQQQAGDNQAPDQTKKKKAQQGQDQEMTTGSTGKVDTEITAEKKTVIREKIVTTNVTRIKRDRIDFDISIGVAVPTTIELHPLPPTVVEVVPAYSGYLFFVLADGTIVIVEPGSLHIVYVLTA